MCPKSGREHVQAYIQLCKQTTMKRALKLMGLVGAHIEQMRGTASEARDYCRKEASRKPGTTPCEVGVFTKGQGQRNDLLGLADAIKKGAPLQKLVEEFPQECLKYPSGVKLHISAREAKRKLTTNPIVRVYWGPTGTGKTRRAFQEAREKAGDNFFVKSIDSHQWWDGYQGQKHVIFDEFDGQIPITSLLTILDCNEVKLQVKGGMVNLLAHEFWFTSNKPYTAWYPNCTQDQQEALKRRITHECHMEVKQEPKDTNSNGGLNKHILVIDDSDEETIEWDTEETIEDRCARLRLAGQLNMYMMRNDLNEAEQAECATMLIDRWRAQKQVEWEQRIDEMMDEWYRDPKNSIEYLN